MDIHCRKFSLVDITHGRNWFSFMDNTLSEVMFGGYYNDGSLVYWIFH